MDAYDIDRAITERNAVAWWVRGDTILPVMQVDCMFCGVEVTPATAYVSRVRGDSRYGYEPYCIERCTA